MRASPAFVLMTLCAISIAGCGTVSQTSKTASTGCSPVGATQHTYRIQAGDVLQISVWQNKNLDRVATVRPDGKISFPLVNDVRAAGQTPMQLQNTLDQKLQRYLSYPQVSVVVQKTQSATASVLGEVNQPGSYPVNRGATTVLDMLAQAGGFTDFADRGAIDVLRNGPDGTRRIHFHYQKAISRRPGAADFCVQPGDIVVVR